jgi:hypothetical protein
MPELRYPRTDLNRLTLLERTVIEAPLNPATPLPPAFLTQIQTFVTSYQPLVKQMETLRFERGHEVVEKRTAVDKLKRHVRDFWAVAKRRIDRQELNEALMLTYNLPLDGENPSGDRLQDWIDRANSIVEGDAAAVAKGYEPMSNPSAAEVDAARLAAIAEAADVTNADRTLDDAQHALDDMRPEADKLIRLISGQLDMALYGMSADDVRHKKERYGFTYYDRETAVVEEAPAILTTP